MAAYLLDRVKLRDAWLDAADRQAHPARYAFLGRRTTAVRALIAVAVAGATAAGAAVSRWMIPVPIAACAGVTVYAPRPRGRTPRLKDRLVLKNTYVAGGIAGFAVATVFVAHAAAWAVVTVASSASLRVVSPAPVRDWVDLRFALEAAATTLLQALWPTLWSMV